ncbi:MAG: ABC transporter permease [Phycisphaeraceae bacterium]
MPRRVVPYSLFALLLALLGVFLIWPILLTVRGGFVEPEGGFTLDYLILVFRDPLLLESMMNSLMIAVCTTVASLLLAMPLAVLAANYRFPGRTLATSLVLVPLILPPFVGAIGLQNILGRFGAFNALLQAGGLIPSDMPGIDFLGGAVGGRFWGVVIMEALHLYPIVFLNLTAALANLDPTLDEAAANLGAGRARRFWRVTLPLILPGVFAGSTIVFIWSFTELGTPLMFSYTSVLPVQVFWGIQELARSPRPYALVVVMLGVAALFYLLGRLTLGRRAYAMEGKATVGTTVRPLPGVLGWLALGVFLLVTALAVLPHLGVVLTSFSDVGAWYRSILPAEWTLEHYGEALSHDLAMQSIANSLIYASLAMVLCLIVGLAISYLVVRVKVRGGWLLDTLAMLPLAVPGLVLAFGYVAMSVSWPFGEGDPLADWLSILGRNPNPLPLLVVAYAVRRLPYLVRSAAAGLEQTSGSLEEAAWNLGASPLYALRRVVLPLIAANLVAGAILVFSFAMLEVSDSLVLAQQEGHYPITKAIWEFYNRLGDGPFLASAMGVWGMALLTVTLVGASVLMGRKLGAVFRV